MTIDSQWLYTQSEKYAYIVTSNDSSFESDTFYSRLDLVNFLDERKDCYIRDNSIYTRNEWGECKIITFRLTNYEKPLSNESVKEKNMENSKLEMLSTMVTSALAKIIDENSTTTDYKSLTVEDIQNWFDYQASNEDVQNIDVHCFYDILHDSVLEEITARYLRELYEQDRLEEFINQTNIDFIHTGKVDEDDIVDDWFSNADADDIENKADSYTWNAIRSSIIDECKDALDNL